LEELTPDEIASLKESMQEEKERNEEIFKLCDFQEEIMRIRIALASLIGIVMLLESTPSTSQTHNYLRQKMDMTECKIEHLEVAMASIIMEISKDQQEFLSRTKSKFEQFKKRYDGKRISYCLEKYINAELDFTTPGNRGIGQISEYVPRFGAFFRRGLSNMSEVDLSKLYEIIQDIILRGYLVHILFIEESVRDSAISSGEELYQKWIPGIYSSDSSEVDEKLMTMLSLCSNSAFETLKDFINSHKMKGVGFLAKDRTDEIVYYYPIAGFGLRVVETKGY